MKLLNITTKYFLLLLLTVLSLWTALFYFILKNKIMESVDEFLVNRKISIISEIQSNPQLLNKALPHNIDFKIKEIAAPDSFKAGEYFEDFSKSEISENEMDSFETFANAEPFEGEKEPYRRLVTSFSHAGKNYRLTVETSLVDSHELIGTIFTTVIALYLVLLILIVFLNRKLMQKLWQPFYGTLASVKRFKLAELQEIDLPETGISEFQELNGSISQLVQNNIRAYRNQKQFTENASHEIQTPLAIARSKAELLMQSASLSSEQAELVEAIVENLNRLTRLNRSLLLLTRIENNQFPEMDNVNVNELIANQLEDLREFMTFKNIGLQFKSKENVSLQMNRELAEILFANLIKNAIRHNIDRGYFKIEIFHQKIVFENSGFAHEGNPEDFFLRFYSASKDKTSNGLGLAIAKSICDLYGLSIKYSLKKTIHTITLHW